MNILSIDDARKFSASKQVVIITGVTGQDGSIMADYLLKNTDYMIFGGARRLSVSNHSNIDHLKDNPRFKLINFDLTDAHSITQIISQLQPSYFINFAAQSFVRSSWDFPVQTWEANTTSVIHILEALRLHAPSCRFYNAGSSEEFGNIAYSPQNEKHPLRPRSPYGASKAASRQIVKVYRESYGMYAIQGWLFNHEGPRRGEDFVTRKIAKGVARISKAISEGVAFVPLDLGNVDVYRDWSDAEDMIDAVWRMLNQDKYNSAIGTFQFPQSAYSEGIYTYSHYEKIMETWYKEILMPNVKEYIVASDKTHTVMEFVVKAFEHVGIKGKWIIDSENPLNNKFETPLHTLVVIDEKHYRPAEVEELLGDSTLIRTELNWSPKVDFDQLVEKMVSSEVDKLK